MAHNTTMLSGRGLALRYTFFLQARPRAHRSGKDADQSSPARSNSLNRQRIVARPPLRLTGRLVAHARSVIDTETHSPGRRTRLRVDCELEMPMVRSFREVQRANCETRLMNIKLVPHVFCEIHLAACFVPGKGDCP
ncbi:unnamed protein product [Discula destructiva]